MIKVDSTDDFISLLSQNKILIYGAGVLCRYRHNLPYADVIEMPINGN